MELLTTSENHSQDVSRLSAKHRGTQYQRLLLKMLSSVTLVQSHSTNSELQMLNTLSNSDRVLNNPQSEIHSHKPFTKWFCKNQNLSVADSWTEEGSEFVKQIICYEYFIQLPLEYNNAKYMVFSIKTMNRTRMFLGKISRGVQILNELLLKSQRILCLDVHFT